MIYHYLDRFRRAQFAAIFDAVQVQEEALMKTHCNILSTFGAPAVVLALLAFAIPAGATLITSDPSLPPGNGTYLSPDDVHAMYGGAALQIVLSQAAHSRFNNTQRSSPNGVDEEENFDSTVQGNM